MPTETIAERQFSLSFLNTAVDALALVLCGVGLGIGVLGGERDPLLTWLPAAVAAMGIGIALLVAGRRPESHVQVRSKPSTQGGGVDQLSR